MRWRWLRWVSLLAAGLARGAPCAALPAARVWTADALTKVFPDTPPGAGARADLDACRGEWESFQVVVRAEGQDLPAVALAPSDLAGPDGARLPGRRVEVFLERFTRVDFPSGNAVMEPREWPDALLPLRVAGRVGAPAGRNLVFWVTVRVPASARPGRYRGELALSSAGRTLARVPVALRVWDVLLPPANHQGATVALYYDRVREWLNQHCRRGKPPLAEGTREWQALKERYYRFLLDYRLCPYDLPVPLHSPRARAFLRDPRVTHLRLPWLGGSLEAFRRYTAPLRRERWPGKAFYYQLDEPPLEQYPLAKELRQRLREANPGFPYLLTLFPAPALYGEVDIWCPDLGDTFGLGWLDFDALEARRARGEETWWYTMCVPRAPYPTWLVDDAAAAHRIFFWLQALYGITGFVYSQAHGWSEDPYEDVLSFAGSNGDGLLIYPGDPFGSPEPFPSLRLQVLRDGLEDYELLWLLEERTRAVAARMGLPDPGAWARRVVESHCRRLASSLRCFSRRPAGLLHARRELLEEVLTAGRRPWLVAAWFDQGGQAELRAVAERGAAVTVNGAPAAGGSGSSVTWRGKTGSLVAPVTVMARLGEAARVLRRWPPWPAEPPPDPPRVVCPRLARAPVLDGTIGPDEWAGAALLRPLWRANGLGEARAPAECFLGHDGTRLYFAARCPFHAPGDSAAGQAAGLILDPPPRGDARLMLTMTGEGRRYAALRSREGHTVPRLGWDWAQGATNEAWECEMALDLPEGALESEWGLEVTRQAGAEESAWALSYGDIRRLGRLLLWPRPAGEGDGAASTGSRR